MSDGTTLSTVRALLPALGVGFAFTLGGPGEGVKLAFAPAPGSSLTKTFSVGGEYELDELSLIVNGQDLADMLPAIEVSLEQTTRIEVTDAYEAVEDGRPTVLLRTFDALSATMLMEMSPAEVDVPNMESASPLEGKTIAFKWNAEKNEYERSFHEDEGEAELLEGLEEDMDLRVFLPPGEVKEGGSWTVELDELESIVMPGGDLRMRPEGVEMDEEAMKMFEHIFDNFGEEFGELLEGQCKCTFKGTQEEDGARLAEIAIEAEVAASVDLSEYLDKAIRAVIEQQGAGDAVKFSLDTADLNLDFEGSGTLLWDLGAGRVHSFQLGGDMTIGMDFAVGVEVEGESQGIDASMEMSGSLHQEVTTKE